VIEPTLTARLENDDSIAIMGGAFLRVTGQRVVYLREGNLGPIVGSTTMPNSIKAMDFGSGG